MATEHWAASIVVPETFLNGLAASGIGDGIVVEPFTNLFQLPMMGPLELSVGMTITSVSFQMLDEHDGALRGTVRANGVVEILGDSPMPALPGSALVRGDVLVHPVIELFDDGSFRAILDLSNSELVGMELEGIEGLDTDAEVQAQMSQMLFGAVGGELFTGLAAQLGSLGLELGPEHGQLLVDLGVATGPAHIDIRDGEMIVGLPARPGQSGHAELVEVGEAQVGIGLSSSALQTLCVRAATEAFGSPLPLDVDIDTTDRRLGTRVRGTRLVDNERFPDLRSSLRTTLRPRLVGDHIEISVREAWLEAPAILPPVAILNRASRLRGGLASRAPLAVRVPSSARLPVRPDSDATMGVTVSALDVTSDGVRLVISASW